MKKFKVQLEDTGQDLLSFTTNDAGTILEARPFHSKLYEGGTIPIAIQEIGKPCMIHHPPHYNYGFLKYNVVSIEEIEEEVSTNNLISL